MDKVTKIVTPKSSKIQQCPGSLGYLLEIFKTDFFFFLIYLFIYFTLQYCIGFAIH